MLQKSLFLDQLASKKHWLIDGGIGTELERRGYRTTLPFWTARAASENPELLSKIYNEYLAAGCSILTTNTFRISWYLFERADRGDEFFSLLDQACQMCQQAGKAKGALIGGSMTTLEDCYRPDLVPATNVLQLYHEAQISALEKCSIDFILAETINSIREAEIILDICHRKRIPIVLSIISNGRSALLSGEKIIDLIDAIEAIKPEVLSINCRPMNDIQHDVKIIKRHFDGFAGAYANAPGHPHPTCGWSPSEDAILQLREFAIWSAEEDIKIIGGCCGTNPQMLNEMSRILKSR
ncbi:MAG: homocysteine S-methyltransferase family protein [Saprospiraceae bacterium]|nr:homocysteine S-methyltransferase family protein [Saprospiraceae bacterium]